MLSRLPGTRCGCKYWNRPINADKDSEQQGDSYTVQPRANKAHIDNPQRQSAHTLQLLHANLLPASLRHTVGCSTSSMLAGPRITHTAVLQAHARTGKEQLLIDRAGTTSPTLQQGCRSTAGDRSQGITQGQTWTRHGHRYEAWQAQRLLFTPRRCCEARDHTLQARSWGGHEGRHHCVRAAVVVPARRQNAVMCMDDA